MQRPFVTVMQCGGMSHTLVGTWDAAAWENRGTLAAGLLSEPNHTSFAFLTHSGTCAATPQCTALIYKMKNGHQSRLAGKPVSRQLFEGFNFYCHVCIHVYGPRFLKHNLPAMIDIN